MILKKWSLALVALLLVAPLSASALGISITGVSSTGTSTTVLDNGDIITFDLVLENNENVDVFGLGIGVYGYDQGGLGDEFDNHLSFAGGVAAQSVFSEVFDPGPPAQTFGGLDGTGPVREDGEAFPISNELRVLLFNALSLTGSSGDGSIDIGVGGSQISAGDVHFQVSFEARSLGVAGPGSPVGILLDFGTGQFGNAAIGNGGAVLPFSNDSYSLTIVPEPGTALLMGLGLAGLAARRRR